MGTDTSRPYGRDERYHLQHVHLFASNLGETIAFYTRWFDALVVWDGDYGGARNVIMKIGIGAGGPANGRRRKRTVRARSEELPDGRRPPKHPASAGADNRWSPPPPASLATTCARGPAGLKLSSSSTMSRSSADHADSLSARKSALRFIELAEHLDPK